jgi:hypothetical protein
MRHAVGRFLAREPEPSTAELAELLATFADKHDELSECIARRNDQIETLMNMYEEFKDLSSEREKLLKMELAKSKQFSEAVAKLVSTRLENEPGLAKLVLDLVSSANFAKLRTLTLEYLETVRFDVDAKNVRDCMDVVYLVERIRKIEMTPRDRDIVNSRIAKIRDFFEKRDLIHPKFDTFS